MEIEEFVSKALAMLRGAQERLQPDFTNVALSVSEETSAWSRNIVLTAIVEDAPKDRSDLVQLIISFSIAEERKVNAVVTWGADSPHVEAEFGWGDVELTPDNLDRIYKELPRLIGAFQAGVARGAPPGYR